mgnify:FL=1
MSAYFETPINSDDELELDPLVPDDVATLNQAPVIGVNPPNPPIVPNAIKPRVGGVIAGTTDVWVGGSNIRPQLEPVYLGQHRPSKYASAMAVQTKNEAGIPYKHGCTEADSDVQFTLWIDMIAQDIEEKGLDSLILVPNATWTTEVNIIKTYGAAKLGAMRPWIRQLTTDGVEDNHGIVARVCAQDLKNLRFLAKLLLDSLKPKFKSDVIQSTGVTADGITVFCTIIQKRVLLNASLQRELIATLSTMRLTQQEGENVEIFNQKLTELITRILNAPGGRPTDLSLLVIKCFLGSSVPAFAQRVNTLYVELSRDPSKYSESEIISELEELFETFHHDWPPSSMKTVTHQEFTNKLNQLTTKNNGTKSTSTTPTTTMTHKVLC